MAANDEKDLSPDQREEGSEAGGARMQELPEDEAAAVEEVPAGSEKAQAERPQRDAGGTQPYEAGRRAEEEIRAVKAERDRIYDAWLRTSADFDNFRKRTERERDEFRQYAIENLVLQLLPVVDNFQRALESLPPGTQRGFAEGVNLIYKQLGELLTKHGVTPIDAEGELFDPHVHEAVETETRSDLPHHSILCERQKGYRLGKRVIRPARVKVSVRPDDEAAEAADESLEEAK